MQKEIKTSPYVVIILIFNFFFLSSKIAHARGGAAHVLTIIVTREVSTGNWRILRCRYAAASKGKTMEFL